MAKETIRRARGRPRSAFTEKGAGTVKALERGLSVLELLAREGRMTLGDLAGRLDLPVSTAHRILNTLAAHGFAGLDEQTQSWGVGLESYRIGSAFLSGTNLVEVARPVLRRLMEASGETANLGIEDGGEVVFIGQVETHKAIRAFFRSGTRGAIHASGIGKALMAEMPAARLDRIVLDRGLNAFTPKTLAGRTALDADLKITRTRGYAFDDEERYLGMRCVAASIFDAFGEPVAGLSVSGPTVRMSDAEIARLGPLVVSAAAEVTGLIGGRVPEER